MVRCLPAPMDWRPYVCATYVFRPRQDPGSAYAAFIPIFIAGLREGRPLTIHGDGSASRDFTYVANVVEANLRAVTVQAAAPRHNVDHLTGRTVYRRST